MILMQRRSALFLPSRSMLNLQIPPPPLEIEHGMSRNEIWRKINSQNIPTFGLVIFFFEVVLISEVIFILEVVFIFEVVFVFEVVCVAKSRACILYTKLPPEHSRTLPNNV